MMWCGVVCKPFPPGIHVVCKPDPPGVYYEGPIFYVTSLRGHAPKQSDEIMKV